MLDIKGDPIVQQYEIYGIRDKWGVRDCTSLTSPHMAELLKKEPITREKALSSFFIFLFVFITRAPIFYPLLLRIV